MRWLAERGNLIISVGYTLSSTSRHLWNIVPRQIACALTWVDSNAPQLGGDINRIALLGESAGGNLVLNVAYLVNSGDLPTSCGGTLPHIAAVVALYPILDPVRMYHNKDALAGPFARMMTMDYTGGTPDQFSDRYAQISPATHLNSKAPPTLLIFGLEDHLLEPQAAFEFTASARAAGVAIEFYCCTLCRT